MPITSIETLHPLPDADFNATYPIDISDPGPTASPMWGDPVEPPQYFVAGE